MSRVSISARAAKLLLGVADGLLEEGLVLHSYEVDAINELRSALAPKKVKPWATTKKIKAAKKKTKREETAEIRARVMARAGGVCEICEYTPVSLDLHHGFGRVRVRQSVENTLAICRNCHQLLTNNDPSGEYWWTRVADAFAHLGLHQSAARARARLQFIQTRKALTEAKP